MLVVRLEDPGLGLDDLAQCPEGDPLSIGQAAPVAPGDQVGPVVEGRAELGDEAALADPGLPHDGDELHRGLTLRAEEGLEQHRSLVLTSDERCVGRSLGLTDTATGVRRAPDRNRLGFPLGGHGLERLERDHALGRASRPLVDDDRSDGRGGLEARSRVDDVACDDSFPAFGARSQRDDGLARRDGGAHRDLEPLFPQLLDRVEDSERRADGALCVVLVRDGRAEDRHHRVSDELLHRSAEALDVDLHPLVVGPQGRANVLGVGAIRAVREADKVDEEHRDHFALLARRCLDHERFPACETEPSALGILLTTRGTDEHPRPLPT